MNPCQVSSVEVRIRKDKTTTQNKQHTVKERVPDSLGLQDLIKVMRGRKA